jgi:hypothetical protein
LTNNIHSKIAAIPELVASAYSSKFKAYITHKTAPTPLKAIEKLDTFCGVFNICGSDADVVQMAAGIAKYSIKIHNTLLYFLYIVFLL